jgi:hypothetical protein
MFFSSLWQKRTLLCDICRKSSAVYFTEGVEHPDSITVYCWECGHGVEGVEPFPGTTDPAIFSSVLPRFLT